MAGTGSVYDCKTNCDEAMIFISDSEILKITTQSPESYKHI